ncbi:MAG: hypothetical protein ABSF09_11105, partial [Candidatus Bathyarchaeia archaeon]
RIGHIQYTDHEQCAKTSSSILVVAGKISDAIKASAMKSRERLRLEGHGSRPFQLDFKLPNPMNYEN